MKDSGVPWLTDIPAAWRVERGKAILTLQKRPVREEDEVITCFRDGEVVLRSERRTEGFTMSDKEIGYQGINKGDIVIHGMDGFAGAMGVSKSTGKGSPVLVVCTPKYDAVPQFIIYYLRALAMTNVFVALATGIRERSCDLRWNKIAELDFILPPEAEQQAIADFLDKKCGEIDEMVSLQEKIVEELKAYKQSVITEAVCKGLNPDVPMKDSGIEWIGQIPEGWEVRRGKNLAKVFSGFPFDSSLFSLDKQYIQLIRIRDILNNKSSTYYSGDYPLEAIVRKGDILVGMDGDFNVAFWEGEEGLLNQRVCKLIVNQGVAPKFFYYVIQSPLKAKNDITYSTTVKHLATDDIGVLFVPFPPYEEQQAIADYLDKKCTDIDALISLKQSKIDALKEYKKSIIYEYITGKEEIPA